MKTHVRYHCGIDGGQAERASVLQISAGFDFALQHRLYKVKLRRFADAKVPATSWRLLAIKVQSVLVL